jgi:sec-independent protein translocase protein TatA
LAAKDIIMSIGWTEILVVLVLALLLFGRRLPEVARNMGKSLGEFKKGLKDSQNFEESSKEPPPVKKNEEGPRPQV